MTSLPADVKSLLTSLKEVAENGSFQAFINKVVEQDVEIAELKSAKRVQDRQLRDMETRLGDADKRLGEHVKQLSGSLNKGKEQEARIKTLQSELNTQKRKAEDSLRSTQAELDDKSQLLCKLKSFKLELQPVQSEDLESRFEALFQRAFELAKKYFSLDLGVDACGWDVLKGHKAVKDKISLPSADTPTAKNMRIAAFLAVLSSELSEHVFLASYIHGEAGEFHQFLIDLAKREPDLESHLRSVLLKAQQEKDKQSMARRRVAIAAEKVFACLAGRYFDRLEGMNLRTELEAICKQACDLWQYVQTLEESVTPSDALYISNFKIIDFSSPPQPARNQRGQSNGATSAQGPRPNLPTNDPRLMPERVIWPSLVIGNELLANGYALSEDQVRMGKVEEKSEMAQGSRREMRRRSRAASMMDHKAEAKRPFLSPKGGDGQNGN